MKPSKFIALSERRAGRPLRQDELDAVQGARDDTSTGKRDTIKAMRTALARANPLSGTPDATEPSDA